MNLLRHYLTPKNITIFIFLALLGFIAAKVQHIDQYVATLARPGKKFSVSQIVNQFEFNPEWEVKTPPEMVEFVNMVTQQPFYWLGKGFQATAFVSQDGDYVIKFFQQTRLKPVPFLTNPGGYLFSQSFRDRMHNRESQREEIFTSSKMGYEQFPEESGILYVHLNKTEDLIKGIKLHDFTGQMHRFRGDEASFILQRKADYILPTLKKLMESGHVDEAKLRIDQIIQLLYSLAQKGFLDSDIALVRNNNIGFVKERAIYIDTGHIVKHDKVNLHERMLFEFDVRLAPLHDWLKIKYPELADYFRQRREVLLNSLPKEGTGDTPPVWMTDRELKAQNTRQMRMAS